MKQMQKGINTVLFLIVGITLTAQNTVILHVPKALEVNAGADVTVNQYDQVSLGGNPTAQFGLQPYQYHWVPSTGLNDPGIANPVASCENSTSYTLEVTDANGCPESSQVTITVNNIGISELLNGNSILVFPNPSSGELSIDFKGLSGEVNVLINDLTGKTIWQKRFDISDHPIQAIDFGQFSAGQYILNITTDNFSVTRSIIKN